MRFFLSTFSYGNNLVFFYFCESYPSRDAVCENWCLRHRSEERQRIGSIQHWAEWIQSHRTRGGRWGGSAAFPPTTARFGICHLKEKNDDQTCSFNYFRPQYFTVHLFHIHSSWHNQNFGVLIKNTLGPS